ncbi:hypothetical protein GOP47_0016220 [Adiantum capillus-veneris]|uniref:Patatin n=1 Tax=Adiantum capillus-veneris TaxID=13818 RepID=A0A9D4UHF4_ADICA|nr:hypothetical protein GOP47_0016220 [Adiantum capillus-veneris]
MRARPLIQASPVCTSEGFGRNPQSARLQCCRKWHVQSKGNDDEGVFVEDDSLPSSRSSSSTTTLSYLRNRFVEALSAVAASRLKADDTEQEVLRQKWLSSRTASVITTDPQSTLLEPANEDYEKLELTSPGFSFSAAGLLFPYHLGVGQCLIERGYITERTPLSGSSAGAIVCAVIASGLSMEDAMLATKELASDCRQNGTAFRLGVVLKRYLEICLPEDAHIRSSGKIRVAVTQVFRSPRALLVQHFFSKEDLIDALLASCFVPGYLAPRPVTLYRNRICVDGGLTSFMPPTAAQSTVCVCAFPAAQLGFKNIGISPDCNPRQNRASPRQLLNWALEPAADDILENLFDLGYQDALVWVSQYEARMAVL